MRAVTAADMQSSVAAKRMDPKASADERDMKSRFASTVEAVVAMVCHLEPRWSTEAPVSKPPALEAAPTSPPYAALARVPHPRISAEYTCTGGGGSGR
eukprot:scaffold3460_cov115-Isochrysis_galbana.AAC.5